MLLELSVELNGYSVVIPLTMMNNVILGNGNTGKTFIFKKLRE